MLQETGGQNQGVGTNNREAQCEGVGVKNGRCKVNEEIRKSPIGTAVYPHLSLPNTKFDREGIYCVDLELDPKDKEVKKFLNELYSEAKGKYPTGNVPYKKQLDRDSGEETGKVLVVFRSKYVPKLYDIYGQKIENEIIIGMGSVIQVAFIPNFYDMAGKKGMNLYLQAVQVRELKEYQGMEAKDYGFETEERKEKPLEEIPEITGEEPGNPDEEQLPF